MAFWQILHCRRRSFLKRRFFFVIAAAILPFMGYFIFSGARDTFRIPVVQKSMPVNNLDDCPCAARQSIGPSYAAKQTEGVVTSTEGTLTSERNFEHDSPIFNVTLNAHMWYGICGMNVDNLRNWPHFPYFPNQRSFVSEFCKSQLHSVESGARIFGFFHPQVSGMYRFAITSDDTSELWLSSNEDPASSEMIARVYSPHGSAWTVEGDYKKYPDQISKEILLHAGKKYYIESLSKQGSGAAHVAVYWSYGNSTFEIISSKYLSSFYKKDNRQSIPLHAGKRSNISLETKSSLYHFNRLPLINKKDYTKFLPTCPYGPSFLVRQKLQQYQGVWRTITSHVFPQDDTDMIQSSFRQHWCKPNELANESRVQAIVDKFVESLRFRKYSLKKIHKVIHKPDPRNGDRFLLNLELGLANTNQSFRLSEHVYQKKGNDTLCLPEGINWNNNATVYFILPVKDQGGWVHYFTNQLTEASLLTGDTNFHVIIVDFESKDIDICKAFNTSLLGSRHTIVSLTGKFYKTLALNKAVEQVPNAHDIVFLFDLHIDVPADIMDSVRMNTVAGRMAYFPIVGRLACDSNPVEHRGFWQLDGYGLLSIYKSDWDRFSGMNTKDFQTKWGGEDWDLLDRVLMLPVEVERIRYPGLYHYYHQRQWK